VFRNSIIAGHPDAGFSMESDATINDYFVNGNSEFRNNLIHAAVNPFRSGNANIATAAQIQTKAESEGCIVYTDPAAISLENPFYSTTPNFLPKTGSPALTGASFTGMNPFFSSTTFRGAFGATNWTANWTEFDPAKKVY
jgi:hypothetical protein